MKKNYLHLCAILFLMAVLLIGSAPVRAAEKVEIKFPCNEELIDLLEPGTWTFPDGNIHIRGMVQRFREESPDPRDIGHNTVVVNANWQSDFTGPMWGTFKLKTDEGGVWEGTWNGMMTENGSWYNAKGKGTGMYAGMKIWVYKNFDDCRITFLEH